MNHCVRFIGSYPHQIILQIVAFSPAFPGHPEKKQILLSEVFAFVPTRLPVRRSIQRRRKCGVSPACAKPTLRFRLGEPSARRVGEGRARRPDCCHTGVFLWYIFFILLSGYDEKCHFISTDFSSFSHVGVFGRQPEALRPNEEALSRTVSAPTVQTAVLSLV
jgi:hypothetical protein